jgi:hypothetical protein
MKKLSTLLFVFILAGGITATTQAQSPLSFGLKAGLNIADISGPDSDSDTRTGLTGGLAVYLDLPVLPIGIESGLYYSQKGSSYSDSDEFGDFDETLKLDYIEVPILARINFPTPGPIGPHLVAGPYIGFNINAQAEGTEDGFSYDEDISDLISSTDIGLMLGAGLDFSLGVTALNAQVRYSIGLTNVYDFDMDDTYRNSVFSLVVGINF